MNRIALIAALGLACGPSRGAEEPASPAFPSLESHFPLASANDAELCQALGAATPPSLGDPALARRKVVISDLHLGPGDKQGRAFDGLEDFFAGAALGKFLARLAEQPTELIVAGDFIEFWQVEEALGLLPKRQGQTDGAVLAADQPGSLAALDHVIAGHPSVFADLAEFLASGNHRLVFIVGNHDGDLAWPKVQLAIARALGQRDLSKLAFAIGTYVDRGVSVSHGHFLDPANNTRAPVALDAEGRCRLVASWGQVFVAKFLGALEQRFPFVDNLYPESGALLWGVRAEPDVIEPLLAGYRFADMMIGEQSGELNLEALRAAMLSIIGAPDAVGGGWDLVWDRIPGSEFLWDALGQLATDAELAPLRDRLIAAAAALPDASAAAAILADIDLNLLGMLKDKLTADPLAVAAAEIIADNEAVRVVVFGHTHVSGGSVAKIAGGHYANAGTWTAIGEISALKRGGVAWTDLDLQNSAQFPRRLPAVVIDYEGELPRPPHIADAHAP